MQMFTEAYIFFQMLQQMRFESSRKKVKIFKADRKRKLFYSGATDSINLVANSLAENFFKKDDEILLTVMEHHSNIVPWHFLREKGRCKIKWVDCDEQGIYP